MLGFAVLVLLDAYTKNQYFKDHRDEVAEISGKNVFLWIDILPDYENIDNFHVINSVRWGVLFPFATVIIILLTWLLYFTFTDDFLARKKIVYAEIRPREEEITRTISKVNLNTLIETNKRKKNMNYLFDKIWYEKRDEIQHT
jgi:hypothetical protein